MEPSGTVTFLFTDIEGSTRLAQQHRDGWNEIQKRHHAILRAAIEAHGGYVFQVVGDAFCAAFSTAREAVRAAVQIQGDLHNERWLENAAVKVRAGIHTGTAVIQPDGEYEGYLAMSRVQRLLSAAQGGQVLLSLASQELVRDHLPEGLSLRDMGTHRLKDIAQPEHIYQLLIPGLAADFPPIKTLERTGSRPTARLIVRMLGTFDVMLDGRPVIFAGRIAQSLFCYLIRHAGESHRREKLAGMFWPEVMETKARTYLRHELWSIRKSLPGEDNQSFLIADDIAVSLNSSPDYWLDVEVMEKIKESASVENLMDALALYRGDFLPGFYEEWITLEREHLHVVYEKRMTKLLDLLENEQRWKEILEWAERWISLGQGPESAYRALMLAYDGLGEPAKVAATYRRCVEALREQNLEPSEQTRSLAFKRTSRLNIPVSMTSFIGREKELEQVAKLVSKSRLVTLTGSGGVGKTRLAIQLVADILESFPDGVWFLDLAPVMDPAHVSHTLAGVLDLQQTGGQDISYTDLIIGYLHSRRALIIFDNCEHLIEACADLTNSLLTSCEHLSILATSREPLRVSGEVPYRVPSLSLPDLAIDSLVESLKKTESIRLFTARASVADARFLIGPQNALTVAKICQRLDGIPLAIELAAARVNMLTVEKISQRLDDRFNLLTNGLRSALPRHRTLRAAIEWSYDLLSEKEQILFRRLAVFVGGWTLDAVEEVCSGDGIEAGEILDLLAQLVNKSLVLVDPRSEESRYRRLETIRQFAYGKFLESGENDYLRRKHYSYFLDLAEQVDRETDRPSKHKLKERLEADNDNFRAALEWCILEKNTEFALRLLRGWAINGRLPFGEIQNWFDRVLTLPNVSAYSEIYAKLLNFIGVNSWSQNKFDYAKSIMVESQMIWQKLGEEGELGLAQSLRILGEIAATSEEGRSIAQSFLEKSLELYQKHGNEWAVGQVIFSLGHKAMWEGRYEEATENFKKALEIWKKIDAILGMAVASNELGELARLQGDFVRAGEFYGQSLGARRKQGNRTDLAGSLSNYAWATLRNGDYHYAKELFKESLELCIIDRNMFLIMLGLAGLAGFLEMSGKHEEAAQLFGASECLYKSSGGGLRDPADQNDIDYYLAMVREQLDEATFAKAWSEGSHMTLEQAVAFARTKTSL